MDFDDRDRRIAPEERFSGLSEGQRYALALVLNLAFVGVVIAGFALLYTSGVGGGGQTAGEPESAPVAAAVSSQAAPASGDAQTRVALALPEDSPTADEIEAVELPPAQPRAALAAPGDGAGGPESADDESEPAGAGSAEASEAGAADADADPADAEEEPIQLAALEIDPEAPVEAEPDAAIVEEVEDVEDAAPAPAGSAEPVPRLAPRVAMRDSAAAAATLDPTASLWPAAGQLAANLQREFPCSRFSLQADSRGEPTIQARVGFSDDIERVRSRVNEGFADKSDVQVGLGCTTVIGGGYVALADSNGRVTQFDRASLSRDIRAALPGEGTCAVIGQVVGTQPQLRQTLMSDGAPATWVRSGGEPALCEATSDGMWQVTPASSSSGRRAAALVLGDDLTALDARRTVDLGPPAETTPAPAAAFNLNTAAAAPPPPAAAPAAAGALSLAPGRGGLVEVTPIEGPSPSLPPGAEPSTEGYAVTVGFAVDPEGKASDLTVMGAGMAGLAVVAEALDVVANSRFPANGSTYRASYTVRFPSAEFQDLLARLSLATAAERDASPVWDRAPTQTDFDRVFPLRALRRGISGEVSIACLIGFDGKLDCTVAEENPRGWGFGAAALDLAAMMQASPRMSDNGPSANESVTLEFQFTAAPF